MKRKSGPIPKLGLADRLFLIGDVRLASDKLRLGELRPEMYQV